MNRIEVELSHMSLSQLIELETKIKDAKVKLVKVVKNLPIVTIAELKAYNNGDRIHAIAAYRDRTGLGLFESRQAFMLTLEQNDNNSNIK